MTKFASLALFVLAACPANDPTQSGDDDNPPEACSDPRYGDGTCNLDLSCDAPDIDCYQTFADDNAATTWWNANQPLGSAYTPIPQTDPRFVRVRASLDAGWAAFAKARPVGDLANEKPALVVIDRPLTNGAFVVGEKDVQPFVVMVETGSLASTDVTDDALLGVMMHELQHAIGLHKLGTVADDLRKFYVAKGSEPLGRDQTNDSNTETLGLAWMDDAGSVGPWSQASLGGLPLDPSSIVYKIFSAGASTANQTNASACAQPLAAVNADLTAIVNAMSPVDQSLPADTTSLAPNIEAHLSTLSSACFTSSFPYDVLDIGAAVYHTTRAQFAAALDPHTLSLVQNVPFMQGIDAVTKDMRTQMRSLEQMFQQASGTAWSGLRYFSYEEDADDVSEMVMKAAGKEPTAMGTFLHVALGSAAGACDQATTVGYGVDLNDAHHGTCWRIGHLEREANSRERATPIAPIGDVHAVAFPALPQPRFRIAN
ncbi:MAG: hypothetical protein QM831_36470 [Kofleriaceae bacterium]